MNLSFSIRAHTFPNYLIVNGRFAAIGEAPKVDVGSLTKAEAERYWDDGRGAWLEHWEKRKAILDEEKRGAKP